jgi:hypothetical protein
MQARGARARVGENLYAGGPATVARPLKTTKELARETGLAERPTANEPRSDGGLQKKPWTSCRGPTSKITNNRVFHNGYLKKNISEGRGGYEQYAFQGVEGRTTSSGEPRVRHPR